MDLDWEARSQVADRGFAGSHQPHSAAPGRSVAPSISDIHPLPSQPHTQMVPHVDAEELIFSISVLSLLKRPGFSRHRLRPQMCRSFLVGMATGVDLPFNALAGLSGM